MAAQVQPNGSTSTSVIELGPVPCASDKPRQPASTRQSSSSQQHEDARRSEEQPLPAPTTATETPERWNYPRKNIGRIGATFWAFLVMGANDSAYGVCCRLEFPLSGGGIISEPKC